MATRAAIFDINETVLDLAPLDPLFHDWFGDSALRREWFRRTLHLAMTLAATRAFEPFDRVGEAALREIGRERDRALPPDAATQLRGHLLHLPPHPEVVPALTRLREAGIATAALSNNPLPLLREQLRNAGIAPLFDDIISVDEAAALKPAPEVYHLAVRRLGLPSAAIWMVAAHGWDIAGATRAGLRGAFVRRPGLRPDPFAPPLVIGNDMVSIAGAIISLPIASTPSESS